TRCIREDYIGVRVDRTFDGFEHDAAGVGSVLAVNHLAADALTPDFQLLHSGGPEGVTRREHANFPLRPQLRCQLANCGGLASSVDTHQHHDRWLLLELEGTRLALDGQNPDGFRAERLPHLGFITELVAG